MKFSIRDLFLVTVIAALAVGWWVERRDKAKPEDAKRDAENDVRYLIPYAYNDDPFIDPEDKNVEERVKEIYLRFHPERRKNPARSNALPNSSEPIPNPPSL